MNCPKCDESMVILELNQIEIDYCTSCSGIWFDHGEIELLFSEINSEDQPKNEFLNSFNITESHENKIKCPVCRKNMEKVKSPLPTEIVIDRCKNYHGIWFDFGELNQLAGLIGKGENSIYELLNDVFKYKLNQNKGG